MRASASAGPLLGQGSHAAEQREDIGFGLLAQVARERREVDNEPLRLAPAVVRATGPPSVKAAQYTDAPT